uniref:E2F transcription factor CC-MB domain-containing protein n=1 Tax=Oryzias latipes TaxID=8090 RepID=A0A3B3IFF4_ORYLA
EEKNLDRLIQNSTSSVPFLTSRITYAYLTYKDIREIPSLKEETVILIKAPPETTLQVPHPEESLQVYLHSVFGPIDALLCSDELVPVESVGAGRCSSLAAGREGSSHTPPFSQVSSGSLLQVSPETTGIVTEKHLLYVSMRLFSLKSPVLQKTESAESLIIQTCSQS